VNDELMKSKPEPQETLRKIDQVLVAEAVEWLEADLDSLCKVVERRRIGDLLCERYRGADFASNYSNPMFSLKEDGGSSGDRADWFADEENRPEDALLSDGILDRHLGVTYTGVSGPQYEIRDEAYTFTADRLYEHMVEAMEIQSGMSPRIHMASTAGNFHYRRPPAAFTQQQLTELELHGQTEIRRPSWTPTTEWAAQFFRNSEEP
jgi:hypothetical protein